MRRRGGEDRRRSRSSRTARRRAKMPSAKPKSPTRLTTKALIAAALADGLLVPEADQQIGREAHAFPAEEQLHEVVGRHQHQHGEGEQRQIGEEARPVRVLVPCSRWNRGGRARRRVVTTTSITAVSVSMRSAQSTCEVARRRSRRRRHDVALAVPRQIADGEERDQASAQATNSSAGGDQLRERGRRCGGRTGRRSAAPSSGRKTMTSDRSWPLSPSSG